MFPIYRDFICKYIDTEQIDGVPARYIEDYVTLDLLSIESYARVDDYWTRVTMRSGWAYLIKIQYVALHDIINDRTGNTYLNN